MDGTEILRINDELKLKEEISSFLKLEKRIEQYSQIGHIKSLKEVLLPKIDQFSKAICNYESSIEEMK
jgi:hypothetical protein